MELSKSLDNVILINNGEEVKTRPNPEQKEVTKRMVSKIENLKHVIFIDNNIPVILKLVIKFKASFLSKKDYSIVKSWPKLKN